MTTIKRSIICIVAAAAALAAVSCQQDDTLQYNNMTMGNIVDGRFVSDQGNTFNIVRQNCEGRLEELQRAMILCDVLNATSGKENEYDISLTQFTSVLVKDGVAQADALEGDIAVQDPIHIEQLWFSGGYVNMLIRYYAKTGSETRHLVNLVYEKGAGGKYTLNFRHNAFGEVITSENQSQMTLAGGYVSYPITSIITENEADVVLKWKWFEDDNIMGINYNKEKEVTYELKYTREGFEHTF